MVVMMMATPATAESTVETMMSAVETMVSAAESTAAGTRHRGAHACNRGNRRNENLVDLHVFTSFFRLDVGIGSAMPSV